MSPSAFRAILAEYFSPRLHAHDNEREVKRGARASNPTTVSYLLSEIPATGQGLEVAVSGSAVLHDPDSHAGARLEVQFNQVTANGWQPFTPGKTARARDGRPFDRLFLRKRSTVPAALDTERVYVVVDPGDIEAHFTAQPRTPRITDTGAGAIKLVAEDDTGAEVDVLATSQGRLYSAPIAGQQGVAGGAGAVGATVQRMTLASDDPAVTSLGALDDIVTGGRAKVDPIVGQAGVAAGAGDSGVTVQRTVEVTIPTCTTSQATVGVGSATILAANANRRRYNVKVPSTAVAGIYLNFGGTAAAAGTSRLVEPGEEFSGEYRGAINAIRAGGSDVTAYVTEEALA